MAISTQPKCDVNGRLTLMDGSDVVLELVLGYDMGDFSVSGIKHGRREVVPIRRRGRNVGRVYGDPADPTISLTSILMSLTHASAPGSIAEMLLQRGAYSTSKSTGPTGAPRELDLKWEVEGTTFGDEDDIEVIFRNVDFTLDVSEGRPSTLALNGTVYGDIEGDLAAAYIASAAPGS